MVGYDGNIKTLTDAFTVLEGGEFDMTLTKNKYNFYTLNIER